MQVKWLSYANTIVFGTFQVCVVQKTHSNWRTREGCRDWRVNVWQAELQPWKTVQWEVGIWWLQTGIKAGIHGESCRARGCNTASSVQAILFCRKWQCWATSGGSTISYSTRILPWECESLLKFCRPSHAMESTLKMLSACGPKQRSRRRAMEQVNHSFLRTSKSIYGGVNMEKSSLWTY